MKQGTFTQLLKDALSGNEQALKKFKECVNTKAFSDEQIQTIVSRSSELLDKNANAMVIRAFMHSQGQGGPVDFALAIGLYERGITLRYAGAMVNRGVMHANGEGGPVDFASANGLFDRAIELGDAGAMYNRAVMHDAGNGGPVDFASAIGLYDRVIVLEDKNAMNNRAGMYKNGEGGSVDFASAIGLYDRAIILGQVSAMYNRAVMHANGQGGPVDVEAATKLYYRSYEKGRNKSLKDLEGLANKKNASAQFKVFLIYFMGIHTKQDEKKALSYFNKSKQPLLTLLCDKIKKRLDAQKDVEGTTTRLFEFVLQQGAETHSDTSLTVKHLRLKFLLHKLHDEEAYHLYKNEIPSDYPLLGSEYFRLASFLIESLRKDDTSVVSQDIRMNACGLLYRAHQAGDAASYKRLIQLLREQDTLLNDASGESHASMQFIELDDADRVRKYEEENKQKEVLLTSIQIERLEAYLRDTEKNSKGFFPKLISTLGKNNETTVVKNILLELEQGTPLSEIIKKYNVSNVTLSAPLKTFIDFVIEQTTGSQPSRGKKECGAEEAGDDIEEEFILPDAADFSLN